VNTEATANASLANHNGAPQGGKGNRISRKWASVPACFAGDADKGQARVREDHGGAHPNVAAVGDRFERFDGASGDALHLFAAQTQVARLLSRTDVRCAQCDSSFGARWLQNLRRAGGDALSAADTAGEKTLFIARAGRAQIGGPSRFGAAQRESACDGSRRDAGRLQECSAGKGHLQCG
jgi:hypothetical protein